jgi:hypothetical protein
MSFLACGHTPNAGKFANVGKFGSNVRAAIDYLLAQAQPDGSFGRRDKPMPGQAIATLALAQAYGVDDSEPQRKRIAAALTASTKLIAATLEPRKSDASSGGGKSEANLDTDLSLCEWMLAATRACQDVGINVPRPVFQRAAKFVLKCYNPSEKGFSQQPGLPVNPGATGAGLLCLRLLDAPQQQRKLEPAIANTLASNPVDDSDIQNAYASAYFATQAAFQAGGTTWHEVATVTFDKLGKSQQADGGWPDAGAEFNGGGRTYTTATALLALSVPYRLLPNDQR